MKKNLNRPDSSKSDFFKDVHEVVKLVPKGRVTSYGAIAKYLGAARSARIVGYAMNYAHALADVPAHRVVNGKGLLTGKFHFETPSKMEELLQKEGIQVKDNKIIDFQKLFWDPTVELETLH